MKYSKSVREFVLKLDFISPRSYDYIREKFNRNLPHKSCLNKWYLNSGAKGEPGIAMEGINSLQAIVKELQASKGNLYCSLSFDEIFIRPHVQYIDAQKKFQGLITYGEKLNEKLPVATCAIVFMINGINIPISLPIAHHYITSLTKESKANLLMSVISAISETKVEILVLTCDGLPTNFSVFEFLGAKLHRDNLNPYIINPDTGKKIYIMFDACHMLKLCRNFLSNGDVLHDGQNNCIKWEHFENLERARYNKDMVSHKINKKHIDCNRNKMNVGLAAQTLSRSVARSMKLLMDSGKPGFRDCAGTIEYARKINDLFDILNSGHRDKLENNHNNIFKIQFDNYIRSLKWGRKPVLDTRKKTGYLGFLINIVTLKSLYRDYLENEIIEQLPTFSLSQDPLEALFGRIRSKCGNNQNPTVEQFKSAYRKLLINNEMTASSAANCMDRLNIYFVPSTKIHDAENEGKEQQSDEIVSSENQFSANDQLLDAYEEATICQIAGEIESKIRSRANFNCNLYLNILNENDKVCINIFENAKTCPCIGTTYICKVARKYLDIATHDLKFNHQDLIERIQNDISYENVFHQSDFTLHEDHKIYFVKYIIEEFVRIRATCFAKNLSLEQLDKALQHKLNKQKFS